MIETISFFGINLSLYYTFWFFGVLTVLIVGYHLGKHFGFEVSKSVLYVVGAVILGYLLLWITSWVFGGGKVNGLNYVRIVTFMPVSIFILTRILKDPFGNVADFVAPLLALFHGVTHLGCIFPGCCHGYPAVWGLYSNEAAAVCFPSQPLEACSSIFIGILLAVLVKKGKCRGRLYAWYLTLFGGTRFVWEFFRDNEKIWHGISELAFHALFAFILGILVLMFLKRRSVENETT